MRVSPPMTAVEQVAHLCRSPRRRGSWISGMPISLDWNSQVEPDVSIGCVGARTSRLDRHQASMPPMISPSSPAVTLLGVAKMSLSGSYSSTSALIAHRIRRSNARESDRPPPCPSCGLPFTYQASAFVRQHGTAQFVLDAAFFEQFGTCSAVAQARIRVGISTSTGMPPKMVSKFRMRTGSTAERLSDADFLDQIGGASSARFSRLLAERRGSPSPCRHVLWSKLNASAVSGRSTVTFQ